VFGAVCHHALLHVLPPARPAKARVSAPRPGRPPAGCGPRMAWRCPRKGAGSDAPPSSAGLQSDGTARERARPWSHCRPRRPEGGRARLRGRVTRQVPPGAPPPAGKKGRLLPRPAAACADPPARSAPRHAPRRAARAAATAADRQRGERGGWTRRWRQRVAAVAPGGRRAAGGGRAGGSPLVREAVGSEQRERLAARERARRDVRRPKGQAAHCEPVGLLPAPPRPQPALPRNK
jgi:hypothetical protein